MNLNVGARNAQRRHKTRDQVSPIRWTWVSVVTFPPPGTPQPPFWRREQPPRFPPVAGARAPATDAVEPPASEPDASGPGVSPVWARRVAAGASRRASGPDASGARRRRRRPCPDRVWRMVVPASCDRAAAPVTALSPGAPSRVTGPPFGGPHRTGWRLVETKRTPGHPGVLSCARYWDRTSTRRISS